MNHETQTTAIEGGSFLRDRLLLLDPRMDTEGLSTFIPGFRDFIPSHDPNLWFRRGVSFDPILHDPDGVKVVLTSAPSATGKDKIFNNLNILYPGLITRPTSATSRERRDDEINGVDYHYIRNAHAMLQLIREGMLISPSEQHGNYYGLPPNSLSTAIEKAQHGKSGPIIYTQIDAGGWVEAVKYLHVNHPDVPVVKLFTIMPMKYSEYIKTWLPKQRKKDHDSRGIRSTYEIVLASHIADAVLFNPFDPIHPGEAAARSFGDFFSSHQSHTMPANLAADCCV